MKPDELEVELEKDEEELHRLGYAQQLLRRMGGFSSFALSFSVISILTGAVLQYNWGLHWGGPLAMLLGWVWVSVMTLAVAAGLAELASAHPTAGALYHWSAHLGGPASGFVTAWLSTLGMFAAIAGIDYGLAEFVVKMLGLDGKTTVLAVYALLLGSHGALNHAGIGVVELCNRVSAWYHMAGTLLLCAALALLAPHRPISFLLETVRGPGHGLYYSFAIGLLLAQWTFTGYDASACVTEETVDPRHTVPWGVFLSVALSALFGLLLLVAVTLSIPDLQVAIRSDNAFIAILQSALGTRLGGLFIWMAMGAMWFCGLGSVTANSRMLFAFARDGGLGRGRWFAAVSKRFRTPHRAVWLSVSAAFVVALWGGALEIITGASTIVLYSAYGLPIALAALAARRGRLERGPWSLGRYSGWVRAIALAWIAIILVLFVLPPNQRVGYTYVGCLLSIGAFWLVWGRGHFTGPRH